MFAGGWGRWIWGGRAGCPSTPALLYTVVVVPPEPQPLRHLRGLKRKMEWSWSRGSGGGRVRGGEGGNLILLGYWVKCHCRGLRETLTGRPRSQPLKSQRSVAAQQLWPGEQQQSRVKQSRWCAGANSTGIKRFSVRSLGRPCWGEKRKKNFILGRWTANVSAPLNEATPV